MIGLDRKAKPEIREKANIKIIYKALLYLDNKYPDNKLYSQTMNDIKWMVRQ